MRTAIDPEDVPTSILDLEAGPPPGERPSAKAYERELRRLQIELLKCHRWVKDTGQRVVILFEGRDAAGKGGSIRRFTANMNPRGARVVALAAPSDVERGQWYFQRYVEHFPTAGEIVFFDRSWYNRAGVERVMGFCTPQEYVEFTRQVPSLEQSLVHSHIHLFKLWFAVSRAEQARRLEARRTDPLRQWKLSPIDLEAARRWDDYTRARDDMFAFSDLLAAPWAVVNSNDKRRARLESIRHVLSQLPYDHRDAALTAEADPRVVRPAAALVTPSSARA